MNMEHNDKLKEINIINNKCHYFNEVTKIEDLDLDDILIDEKSYKNTLVYNIWFILWIY